MATTYKRLNAREILENTDGQVRTIAQGSDLYAAVSASGATIDPADPPPVVYSGSRRLDNRLRTIDATVTELVRVTLAPTTGYVALLTLVGVDAGNGALRTIRASIVAKRLGNGAALVGPPVVIANHQDAAASTWAIAALANGNDFVITVAGAASRAIDWLLSGEVNSFTPGGQP